MKKHRFICAVLVTILVLSLGITQVHAYEDDYNYGMEVDDYSDSNGDDAFDTPAEIDESNEDVESDESSNDDNVDEITNNDDETTNEDEEDADLSDTGQSDEPRTPTAVSIRDESEDEDYSVIESSNLLLVMLLIANMVLTIGCISILILMRRRSLKYFKEREDELEKIKAGNVTNRQAQQDRHNELFNEIGQIKSISFEQNKHIKELLNMLNRVKEETKEEPPPSPPSITQRQWSNNPIDCFNEWVKEYEQFDLPERFKFANMTFQENYEINDLTWLDNTNNLTAYYIIFHEQEREITLVFPNPYRFYNAKSKYDRAFTYDGHSTPIFVSAPTVIEHREGRMYGAKKGKIA